MNRLLRNTRITTKLTVAFFLLIATGIAFLAYHFSLANREISKRQHELEGNRYASAIREILRDLPLHRGITNAVLNGDPFRFPIVCRD